jgi:predicted branched-subunit amino acid permease
MSSRRETFTDGVLAVSPTVAGVVPFGLVMGITAMATGLSAVEAVAMSLTLNAGAAQLAMLQLLGEGAIPAVIVLTALIINLRFAMYSASLAPHLYHLGPQWRLPLAYILVDQNYALSIKRFQYDRPGHDPCGHWYFLGGGVTLWLSWQLSTLTGVLLGGGIPRDWSLDFAIPLVFMAVLIPTLRHRSHVVAALTGGGVATLAAPLPYNLGLIVGALSGITAGVVMETRAKKP